MHSYPVHPTPASQLPSRNSSAVPSTPVRGHARGSNGVLATNSVLHRILGPTLERHANKDLETYLNAKRKWSECTMEEWKAGADGIKFPYISLHLSQCLSHLLFHRFQKLHLSSLL